MSQILNLKTKYYFGENVINKNLSSELKLFKSKNVMLIYGGGSIKNNNNLYNEIIKECKIAKIKLYEYPGISPNPRNNECDKAAKFAYENNIDLIIAAGGGSVIDASKVISILTTNLNYKFNSWKYVLDQSMVKNFALPIFSIITLAATGSENNYGSVITNVDSKEKRAVMTESALPSVCFADPIYTKSLSKWQTGCGIFDILSHLLEQYFGKQDNFLWNDNYLIANMKTLIKNAYILANDLSNYEARANILFTSSYSLNQLSKFGSTGGDWAVHTMEHAISGLWDVEHGAGLALLTPTYIKFMCNKSSFFKKRTILLAKELFNKNTIEDFLNEIIKLIKMYNLPTKYNDFKQIKLVSKENKMWLINHIEDNEIKKISSKIFNLIN